MRNQILTAPIQNIQLTCLTIIMATTALLAGCQDNQANNNGTFHFVSEAMTDVKQWPNQFVGDAKDTFLDRNNATLFALAGAASIAMHNSRADDRITSNRKEHQVFKGFADESFNIIGYPGTHFAATGLWYAIAANSGDEFNKDRAIVMFRALALTGITTLSLKAIRHNETPNGKSWAWPSGHTSSSFAVAAVLDEFYGHGVGYPAYAVASLVGFRMVDSRDHWASDVVFGAVIGWTIGHTVAGNHKQLEIAGFKVQPYMGTIGSQTGMGALFVKRF